MNKNQMSEAFLSLPRHAKRLVALSLDAFLCAATVWLTFVLQLDALVLWSPAHTVALLVSLLLALPVFAALGLYQAIFRYAGAHALAAVLKAVSLYMFAYALVFTVIGVAGVHRAVGILQPLLLLLAVALSRAIVRFWLGGLYQSRHTRAGLPRVLIYGAGSAGRQLAAGIKSSGDVYLLGLLDDDAQLHGQLLNGLKIFNPAELHQVVAKHDVTQVYLAIPSASRARRNEILEAIRQAHVQVRTLPGLMDLVNGKVEVSDLRELDIEDLLGRDPVPPTQQLLAKNIQGKVVLVTGAGGSIGSELCRQIIKSVPSALLLVEQSEFALYAIHHELERALADMGAAQIQLLPLLASVRDSARMGEILSTWQPQTVYHAAAYKHVPLVEHNPAEGIKNNVCGTWVMAEQAAQHGVADFVLVSTDKAVRPTNVMGTSKRVAEMVLQAYAARMAAENGCTRFSMVRFGNVLGSSGSVVPLFRKQIKEGGPITLTHADITRYFMTIPEAAQLVIQAGAMASGGDVFVLDMGEPVKIIDLAKRMIELSGLSLKDDANPLGDIAIKTTGLRPGEKLYEELLIGDNPSRTSHARIMTAQEEFLPWHALETKLDELDVALFKNDVPLIRMLLKSLVSGYQPDGVVVDWIHLQRHAISAKYDFDEFLPKTLKTT
jgi:FlaA1/EpsC-like NDP-sugar epimerase